MKYIKPIAILAVMIFILSCNHESNKSPEMQELGKEIKTEDVKQEMKSVNNGLVNEVAQSDNKTAELDKADPGDKQQTPPQKKDDPKKQTIADPAAKPDWDKKIIKTANVNLEVKDYKSFYTSLREKVKNMGGYIAQEEQTQSDYKVENTMSIKVPVDQFDNAVVLLTANVEKINERKISSQDVTMEVVDTRSRIEAKKQVRLRYMNLLGEAKKMEDILSVQSEINGIQEEIESATGRIEYLTHSSVFSTINLTYYQVLNSSAKETEEAKKPSFGEKIKDAFRTGWEIVSNLFVVIITVWPLLIASFFVFLLYKKLRTQKPKQA
jgi:Domain of unknown function (DUF4349)